jgi:mono/diheme cytochrome c family protein
VAHRSWSSFESSTGLLARSVLPATVLALLLAGAATAQAQIAAFDANSGAELYAAACAACHGRDGSGSPQSLVGFETPLPDFTDCSFTTPEPDADWLAIAHEGGPVRAFDRRMPAFGRALSEAALRRAIGYIRSFCTNRSWPRGELNLPRALLTEKAFPENEAIVTFGLSGGDAPAIDSAVIYERRIGVRSQLELELPIALEKNGAARWQRGLGDVAAAFKHVLFHSLDSGTIVSVGGEAALPTGKTSTGFGKGVLIVEPFLAIGQMLGADSFIQLQSGMEFPTDRAKADREAFVRMAAGRSFMQGGFGRSWTPMIELAAASELPAPATGRDRETEWNLVPQMQVSLSKRQHVLVSGGLQIPLNDRRERGIEVLTYLLWDWFDGGFFDGWR